MRFDLAKGVKRKMTALLALSVSLLLGTSAFAQVKPGDFITPENAPKVKDIVSPGVVLQSRTRDDDEDRPDHAYRLAAAVQRCDGKIFRAGAAQQ